MINNFVKATSENLPKVDMFAINNYIRTNDCFNDPEVRGCKAQRSARESYGDNAVGYIELERTGNLCLVKGQMCPEHRVRNKNYHVSVTVDDSKGEVVDMHCQGCAASLGGCKHGLAFLMFIHRKSEQQSPTEVECYWKKPRLSGVGTSLQCITAKSLTKKIVETRIQPDNSIHFLNSIMTLGAKNKIECQIGAHKYGKIESPLKVMSMHRAIIKFNTQYSTGTCNNFFDFLKNEGSNSLYQEIITQTKDQSKNALWFELRYGRITATKIFEVSKCKTDDGSLVKQILGCAKVKLTKAMERGTLLEELVFNEVKKMYNDIETTGLAILQDFPIIGASADGIAADFVLEIKSPINHKTVTNYIKNDIIQPKVLSQIQIQMHVYKKSKGLLAIADPDFDVNKQLQLKWVEYDYIYCEKLIKKSSLFWKKSIFPKLL